ncbi:MAG: hypothetical protein WBP41_15440, partial [Saprospiraceae bacterium]
PFQMIVVGEMHGTNESAPFVSGMADLLTSKGDRVQVGLEIPPELMMTFSQLHTDSSIYQSVFFLNPPFFDGKESIAWANLISVLNHNRKVNIFFFDVNKGEDKIADRDSLMAMKIKSQFDKHPAWKMITLGGNYHNRITDPSTMISILKRNLRATICSLNMTYKEGSCNANFGNGLEIKKLGSYPSVFNSTDGYERYIILMPPKSGYDYDGFYYTKFITAAAMVKHD